MKKNKAYLITSITINILLIAYVIFIKEGPLLQPVKSTNNKLDSIDYNISSFKNFNSVFLEKNDSLYHFLYKDYFLNEPEQAFMMSCAYYQITRKPKVLKDVEESRQQLEEIYHGKMNFNTNDRLKRKPCCP